MLTETIQESRSFFMDKLLLHSCCAPCSVYCVDTLRAEGIEPTSLWFNPNIHPWTEYDARRRTLLEYGEKEHLAVHILEDYGLRDFVRAVSADIDHRCAHCYTIRLGTRPNMPPTTATTPSPRRCSSRPIRIMSY